MTLQDQLSNLIADFRSIAVRNPLIVSREAQIGKTTVYGLVNGDRQNFSMSTLIKMHQYVEKYRSKPRRRADDARTRSSNQARRSDDAVKAA